MHRWDFDLSEDPVEIFRLRAHFRAEDDRKPSIRRERRRAIMRAVDRAIPDSGEEIAPSQAAAAAE